MKTILLLALLMGGGTSVDPSADVRVRPFSCAKGETFVTDRCVPACDDGHHFDKDAGKCVKNTPLYVKRGFFGGCPAGYVDHPADPKQCALPWVAHRLLRPRR